ncbi:MAG: hypothetical protein U0353_13695 [Sandaracinus sp.]
MSQDDDDEVVTLAHRLARETSPSARAIVDGAGALVPGLVQAIAVVLGVNDPAMLAIVGGGAAAGFSAFRTTLDNRAVQQAAAELAEEQAAIQANLAKASAAGAPFSAADVRAIIEAYLLTWQTAHDRRVRRMVRDACVYSFDPAAYERGLSGRVMDTLGRLDYPAIELLRRLCVAQAEILPADLDRFFARRLESEGLALNFGSERGIARFEATAFGRAVLEYVDRRPDPDPRS